MTYGLNLFNANGDRVVEFKSTLYAKATGNTRPHGDLYTEADAIATAAGYPATARQLLGTSAAWVRSTTQVAEQDAWAASLNGCRILGPKLDLNVGDTVFYKVNLKGLYMQGQVFCDLPGGYPLNKGAGVASTETDSSLPYLVASTTADTPAGETYGLVLRDEAGTITFDSRKPLFSIFYSTVITSATFTSIIDTGTPVNITLPKAVSGAYVSMPSFVNFKAFNGPSSKANYQVMMKQTSTTNLRLSRVNLGGADATGTFRYWTQDTPLFVGRPL